MDSRNDDKLKRQEVIEALQKILRASDEDLDASCEPLRTQIHSKLIQKFDQAPTELAKKVHEVEQAFVSLTQVKRVLQMHVASGGTEAQEWVNMGRKLFEQRCYKEALSAFEKGIREGLKDPNILLCAATAALYSGQLGRADEYAKTILIANPFEPNALSLKGIICMKMDQYPEAYNFFFQARKIKPSSSVINKYFDQVCQRLNRFPNPVSNPGFAAKTEVMAKVKKFHRRHRRARIEGSLQIQDFATNSFLALPLSSLSAGGCLVKTLDVPESFYFVLNVKGCNGVTGLGQKIYQDPQAGTGIKFVELPLDASDAIEHLIRRLSA